MWNRKGFKQFDKHIERCFKAATRGISFDSIDFGEKSTDISTDTDKEGAGDDTSTDKGGRSGKSGTGKRDDADTGRDDRDNAADDVQTGDEEQSPADSGEQGKPGGTRSGRGGKGGSGRSGNRRSGNSKRSGKSDRSGGGKSDVPAEPADAGLEGRPGESDVDAPKVEAPNLDLVEKNKNNFVIESDEHISNPTIGNNLRSLETLKKIEAEGRTEATPEEKAVLARYAAWDPIAASDPLT